MPVKIGDIALKFHKCGIIFVPDYLSLFIDKSLALAYEKDLIQK